jgi:hypothetical protein
MTTYQDPPPLSRRAARQTERAQIEARETAERATEEHVLRPASGRRALPPEPSAPAEPLTYVTQSRPNLPTYAGRNRPLAPVDAGDAMPPTQALAKQDHPSYRSRDYSPEARRTSSAFAAPQPRAGGDLDYFTQGGPGQLTLAPPQQRTQAAQVPTQLPVAPGAAASDPVPNATLTRRELRAIRAAAQSQIKAMATPEEPPTTEAVDFLLASGPIDLPKPARATSSAPVSALDALSLPGVALTADAVEAAKASPAIPPRLVEPQPAAQKYPSFTDLIGIQRNARADKERAADEARKAEAEAESEHSGIEALFDDEGTPTAVAPIIKSEPSGQDEPRSAYARKPFEQTTAPVGDHEGTRGVSAFPHWSQSEVDGDTFPPGMSRGFASGSTGSTPASLVLPSVPNPSELSYSLSTGEILVTGSIDLPRSLGATGAHPDTLDDAIDHLLDADDEEMKTTGSTPVRAIRAVSSHTSTRGMIAAHKPKSNRLPTILAISASAMAAVVLTLGIVSVATGSL